jgi:GNAT superfamily N-acetyltransferase/anti-sigma regulatory factor (Ser/Thr protein kinase)
MDALTLRLPAIARFFPLVQSHGRALAALAGFDPSRQQAIELAFEEAFALVIARAAESSPEPVVIEAQLDALALTVRFDDRAIPPGVPASPQQGVDGSLVDPDLDDVSRRLIRSATDEAQWVPLGRAGNRLEMRFLRPSRAVDAIEDSASLSPYQEDAPLAPAQEYIVRLAGQGPRGADDWPAIARAMYKTYGFSYVREDFYIPERIRSLNEAGLVVSVVAESELTGEVVAHYGLDVIGFGQFGVTPPVVGELGKAVVDPSHRGRGLMERMRRFTEDLARDRGLQALFSEPTMVHPYSQKANETLGARACAVMLGLFRTAENRIRAIHTPAQQQRGSLMMYFQPLQPPASRHLVLPARHRDILIRTYDNCGIAFSQTPAGGPAREQTDLQVRFTSDLDMSQIRVLAVGQDIQTALRAARDELVRRAGSPVILMQIRLDDPGTDQACEAAERLGFFYSGMCPLHDEGCDVLQLQYVEVEMDIDRLAVAGPFARELVDYVAADRARIDAR